MHVGDLCNRDVVIIDKEASVVDACRLMREFHVGDVIVVEGQEGKRRPIGILTDRDVVVELIAEEVDFSAVAIKDVMSFELLTAREEDEVMDAMEHMRSRGLRRLPVVNQSGTLVGVLTVDDLIDIASEQLSELVSLINREQKREQVMRR